MTKFIQVEQDLSIEYNMMDGIMQQAPRFGPRRTCMLLGRKGDHREMQREVRWVNDKQATKGKALVYDVSAEWIGWVTIYRNTKGYYIKKHGNHYLELF